MTQTQTPGVWRVVGAVADFMLNELVPKTIDGQELVLVNIGDSVVCFADQCSHQPVKLSDFGEVQQGLLQCHAHGAQFDLCASGKPLCFPAVTGLTWFPVRVVSGQVEVFL